ncbi:MAG: FAD-dependent oxidoreductase [Bryobacterales bacterium]|nr:FAD-dependent oxidoreductase [Bryobacterales bacterium]
MTTVPGAAAKPQYSRRRFLSAALIGLAPKTDKPIQGGFADTMMPLGHRLRDRVLGVTFQETVRVPLVIVGAGIAGLSAAWHLDKRGFRDFVLLEMDRQAGGNSKWGENEVSAYPWAAHYLPVPSKEVKLVYELMEELGVYHDGHWEERHLCHSPQERLYLHGRWQEGLEPEIAATKADRAQYKRFHERMREFEQSGEWVIPMDNGKRKRRELDQLSMADWMRRNGYDSPYLHWLVDYSCRDD